MVTLSTAESELAELVEAMTAGESVASMVDELLGPVQRGAFTDSQAAAAIITTDGGSWRTRHLRTRASFARQSVLSGLWAIRHILRAVMVADIGTKPLTSTRLDCLKELMMMSSSPKKEEEQKFEEQKDEKGEKRLKEKREEKKSLNSVKVSQDVLKLVTTIAILAGAKAEDEDQEGSTEGSNEFWFFQAVFATVVVLLTVFFQWLWKVGVRLVNESAARSHPGAGGEKENEEKRKEGRSGGEKGLDPSGSVRLLPSGELGLDQRGSVRLPQSGELGLDQRGSVRLPQGRELGLDQRDPVRLRQGGRDGEPEEVPSCGSQGPASSAVRPNFLPQENSTESSSELSEESSQDEMGNQIINEMELIAQEENEIRERLRHAPPEDEENAPGPGFGVLTTRYGQVYHLAPQCPYLLNPRVGPARPSRWCTTCRLVSAPRGLPPPGFPLLISGFAGRFHTDFQCPHRGEATEFSLCIRCSERMNEWAA